MVDRFEEDLGKYTYITLAQVKDYLSISSNTQDARLSNIIHYATGVIEHYIGHEVLANDYVEIFDGGTSSVFVNRLPLSNVYLVSEFNGSEHVVLADPTTIGMSVQPESDSLSFSFANNAAVTTKVKRFGKSSLKLGPHDYIYSDYVPNSLQFEDGDFTIEMFVRVDDSTLQNNVLLNISDDTDNYLEFRLANLNGLAYTSTIAGVPTTIQGSNTFVEAQQFTRRKWAHVAVSRDLSSETLKMFYNGNTIASASYTEEFLTFSNSIAIGTTFKGYIDEIRVSDIARYSSNFTPPTNRFRPDDDTVLLVHFDTSEGSTIAADVHAVQNQYNYARDTGEVTKSIGGDTTYPVFGLGGQTIFQPYPNAVRVEYRAGYENTSVPYDIQMATLDFIKLLYKQDQEKKGFSFEGESGDSFPLAGNFPPHIRRILDLYRVL